MAAAYDVYDQHQQLLGARGFLTKRYEVRDAQGEPLLAIEQPAKTFKSKFAVSKADGTPVGAIEQRSIIGKARLEFSVNGAAAGGLEAESWASRNFVVTDEHGRQVATVTKRDAFDKTSLKEIFTTGDSYVLERPRPLAEPLASMVVATALCLDAAFHEPKDN